MLRLLQRTSAKCLIGGQYIRASNLYISKSFLSGGPPGQPDLAQHVVIAHDLDQAKADAINVNSINTKANSPDHFTGEASNWSEALQEAQNLLVKEPANERTIDPAKLVGDHLKEIKTNITKLLGSDHPFLNVVARHYFSGEGKHVRPLLVLLIAQATSIAPKMEGHASQDYQSIDTPISHGLKNIVSGNVFDRKMHYTPSVTDQGCTILPTQRRLAEISEMIHTASLLHDDVIDASLTRRNLPSANASFGNKMAVLGGDFMIARASIALARLRNAECTALMSACISSLVEGEFMQLRNTKEESGKTKKMSTFDHYMTKTYMKTGSLIAQSCKASAVLGNATPEVANVAFEFGKNLGLAFQVKSLPSTSRNICIITNHRGVFVSIFVP
jgi:hexaprenyl-diphosphate synthase